MTAPAVTTVVAEVQLGSFRCFESTRVEPGPGFNLIVGDNASGKTSFLEALYCLGRGRSFRAARAEAAIRFEADHCTLFARLGIGVASRLGIEVSRAEGLSVRLDGVAGTRGDLVRALPVQLLDPASHELVSGAPSGRRQFLDWSVFHVEQNFLAAWQRYRKVLQQRNAALKSRNAAAAWHWDSSFVTEGMIVDECRRRLLVLLQPRVQKVADRLLGASLDLHYQPGWAEDLTLESALLASRDRDLQMATSTVGPHRSDFRITLRTRRARDTASRGQEKLIAAALTIAQLELVATARLQPVVLLLDEPAADLDRRHLALLLAVVGESPFQSFVTALDSSGLKLPDGARAFHVERMGGASFAIITG